MLILQKQERIGLIKHGMHGFLGLALMCTAVGAMAVDLPGAVQKELNEIRQLCTDVGGRLQPNPKLHQVLQLRPVAPKDHVINTGAAACKGGPDPFGGSGGAAVIVYAAREDGTAIEAFSQGADGVRIGQQKGSSLSEVSLLVGGQLCGQNKSARVARVDAMRCWRPIRWSPTKNEFEFAPLSEMRPVK